jgi:hypothetical protein
MTMLDLILCLMPTVFAVRGPIAIPSVFTAAQTYFFVSGQY